jgi:predicted exporter
MPALAPVERPESDVVGEVVLLLVSLTSLVEPALGVTSVVMGLAASLVEADGFLSE